ncbi:MAG: S41 family peptidase [Holosporales bacterium]|jgi:carboxyl-terminal processing protease|nr:S41 family peptidase [Holosporales bacterium]
MSKFKLILLLFIMPIFLVSCKKEKQKTDVCTESANSIATNNLIKDVIEEIRNNYAGEITREKLEEGAINGMLESLDAHSMYISQDEFEAFYKSTRGVFLGIGIETKQLKDSTIEIISIINDSPASKAGLKIGDVITKMDEKSINELSMKEIISKFSSDSALKIKLSVVRNKNEKFEINLKKSFIQIQSVKLSFSSDIAIIKITHFNEGTVVGVTNVIKNITKKKSTAVILDLRNNPGGILEQAIEVSDLFLDHGKIVEFQSRHPEESKIIYADDIDLLNHLPMVTIIDANTASGAELVAAALGENKRSIIIGTKSYGKGSLQTIIPIPGRGAMKLTTAYFISPNGNKINQNGITPDIEIEQETVTIKEEDKNMDPTIDPVIQRAIDLLHGISALKVDNK